MVRVSSTGSPFTLFIPGLDNLPPVEVGDFWIDRFEVSNREFKKFVQAGGYEKREYWKQPFERNGRAVPWEEAMRLFRDMTGRPGPATWELGAYPEGEDEYPVGGVSWYEAAAFAEYVGKALPTIYHWSRAANQQTSASVVPVSNFNGRGAVRVGSSGAVNRFGAEDMAGNVKEWCWNSAGVEKRYILGGGWNEPAYQFVDPDATSPFERAATYGFRCIRPVHQETLPTAVAGPIAIPSRDYKDEHPVDDEAFRTFRSLYSYDKRDLRAKVEAIDESDPDWRRERVSFDAAYGGERVTAYLYIPKVGRPPNQVVVFFPGSNVLSERSFDGGYRPRTFDFIVKSGRVLVYPVYKSTFERGDSLEQDFPDMTSSWRDHVIMWSKDLGRTIDYLETRTDIAPDKVGYFGASWGGDLGAILPAVEPRLKASVLYVAGFPLQRTLPEVDAINFAPRVTIPTLMLNGKYDFFDPVETSQLPMFRFLGTSPNDKRQVIYETSHSIPRSELIKETLDWFDKYLGPVRRQ
jgi:dienelactone hydrolase